MDLATLIQELRLRGDQLTSCHGVKTNVDEVSELKGENGNYSVELKVNLSWQDIRRIVQIADDYINYTEPTTTEKEYYEQVLKQEQEALLKGSENQDESES